MENDKPLSFSIWVNSKPVTRHGFDGIQRCSRGLWVEDSAVTRCHKCKKEFGWTLKYGIPYREGKHHCIVAGTPVTLANGTAVPIELVEPTTFVPAWNEETIAVDTHNVVSARLDQGTSCDCVELKLQTGRVLCVTSDHLVLSLAPDDIEPVYRKARDLNPQDHRIVCSTLQGVLDIPNEDEVEWKMPGTGFTMDSPAHREQTLAFARLCGYNLTDGNLAPTPNRVVFCCGEECDARNVCLDIGAVTGTTPQTPKLTTTTLSSIFRVQVHSRELWSSMTGVGITTGSKVDQGIRLPSFIWDEDCPVSVQREFLAAWMGGDGNRPRKGNNGKSLLFDPMLISVNAKTPKILNESRRAIRQLISILKKNFGLSPTLKERPLQGFVRGLYTVGSHSSPQQLGVRIDDGEFVPQLDSGSQYLQLLADKQTVQNLPEARVLNGLKRAELVTEDALNITAKGVERLNTVLCMIEKARNTPDLFRVTVRVGFQLPVSDISRLHETIGYRFCAQKQEKLTVCAAFESYRETFAQQKLDIIHYALDSILTSHPEILDPRKQTSSFRQPIQISDAELDTTIANVLRDCSEELRDAIGASGLRHLLKGTRRTYDRPIGELTKTLSTLPFNEFLRQCGFDWDAPSRTSNKWIHLSLQGISRIADEKRVFDLTVPDASSFVADGIVVHNCRFDGRIYCDDCSSRRAVIPLDIPIPEPINGTNEGRDALEPLRVCDDCFVKLYQLRRSYNAPDDWKDFTVFMDHVTDIRDLKALSQVCREWNKIANYHLSRFFQLQYHLQGIPFHQRDRNMLWANRHHFSGHSRWMVQLVRSIRYQTAEGLQQLPEVCQLILSHLDHPGHRRPRQDYRGPHWNLMCTRDCSHSFTLEELVVMLDEAVPNEAVREILVEALDTVVSAEKDEDRLFDYIALLVHHMSTADCAINESVIGQWLMRQSAKSVRIANEVYLDMVMGTHSENERDAHMYRYWLERWVESVPMDVVNTVLTARAFAEGCCEVGGDLSVTMSEDRPAYHHNPYNPAPRRLTRQPSIHGSSAPDAVTRYLRRIGDGGLISPTHPERGVAQVLVDKVRVKESITRPIAMPLVWNSGERGSILFKAEDLRKDHIVMNFIRLADRILKRELDIDLNIVTYRIRPTGPNAGFIEMVSSSTTLYDIDAEHKCDMFNYVDEDQRISQVRQRFMRSTAAYCVLTFLLGAGDRHKHNIMITKEGVLFHIDYGYVMGVDPKQNPLLPKVPDMSIRQDIVDALGPPEQFREFEELVDQIYNCLRRHVQELTAVLRLLVLSRPTIHIKRNFTEKKLMREVLRRFAPGEHHEQARIQIINRVHNSTRSTTHYAIVDSLHHQAQTNVVLKALAQAWHGVKRTLF